MLHASESVSGQPVTFSNRVSILVRTVWVNPCSHGVVVFVSNQTLPGAFLAADGTVHGTPLSPGPRRPYLSPVPLPAWPQHEGLPGLGCTPGL